MTSSAMNPQFGGEYSPLDALIVRALRRYGEAHPGTVDGDSMLVFLDFANEIVEEVRTHVYWAGGDLPYYTHQSETRPIPDAIMIAGLMALYGEQQYSEKARIYSAKYYSTLNRVLAQRAGMTSERPELKTIER